MSSDKEIEQQIGLSREDHENRNKLNELPAGLMNPSPSDPTLWMDEKGRPWKLNAEPNAAYHQPTGVAVSFVKAHLSKFMPFLKVPNLKFISPNEDGRYSEVIADRYTGELVIVQKIMGTFNLCTDAPDGMIAGKLPTDGEHKKWDIDPHNMYGGGYKQVAKGIDVGSVDKGPVILGTCEEKPSASMTMLQIGLFTALAAFVVVGTLSVSPDL
jgi:hypothetical protein